MAKIPAKATKLDIIIEQGASFSTSLTWTDTEGVPVDLTSYTALIEGKDASGTVIITWTEGDAITLGGTLGTIDIDLTKVETAAYTFDTLSYCLLVTDVALFGTRLLKGSLVLDSEC